MQRSLFAILVITAISISAQAKYSGGSGTSGNPYKIANTSDLLTLAADANDNNKCFILTADIDLDPNLPGNRIFTTAVISLFVGSFDGRGHTISNMTINSQGDEDSLGLFGLVEYGEIKNLSLKNIIITGGDNSGGHGGLVGWNQMSNVDNCSSTGTIITGDNSSDIGGLVGDNVGNISNCFSTVTVTGGVGSRIIGGLVGWNFENISKCFSLGTIKGKSDLGGLAGGNGGTINNCYSTSDVNGAFNIGGLAGGNMTGSIINCYSTGFITYEAGEHDIGGLAGWNFSGSINNCYFLKTSGPDNGLGTDLTDEQMKQQANFAGWDFVNIWQIAEGIDYPKLRAASIAITKYSGGSGTSDDPYQIASAEDLLDMAANTDDYSAYFVLTADIDLAGKTFTTAVIAPDTNNLNYSFDGNTFTGSFNGDGHKISNLTIRGAGTDRKYWGLFGIAGNSTIKGIQLENVKIIGLGDCGNISGLAGKSYRSSISNCSVKGTIMGGWAVGGLVGESINNVINNCSFVGNISGRDMIGGLVGYCWDGIIYVIPGTDFNDYGDINNCYTSGTVTGGDNSYGIGGLLGGFGSDINNCYSTCKVTAGNNSNTGALAGANYCTTKHSYFLKGSGTDNGIGEPLTDAQMKRQSSFKTWDFVGEAANGTDDIWMMFEGVDYPKLAWSFDGNCPIAITKCTFTIHPDNYNSILITGKLNATTNDFMTAKDVNLFIDADYRWPPYRETFPINYGGNFKNDKFWCEVGRVYLCDCKMGKALFKYDTKTGNFLFKVNDYGLGGFSCPMTLRIDIGDYNAVSTLDESIVNGKRPIPINLLMGVKNSLRIDKSRFTHNKTTSQITRLTISGGLSVDSVDDSNLAAGDFSVNLGGQVFTIPAGKFKANKKRDRFTCSKVLLSGGEIAAATFDFNKCTFTLTIKGTKITDAAGAADFNMEFGDFSEGAEVLLP